MFYKLLGMVVWKGAKTFLRRKYGRSHMPKPLLAGAAVILVGLLALVFAGRRDGE